MTFVVILTGGGDLPQAYGPFEDREEAGAFAEGIPAVWVVSVAEIEDPATFERD